MFTVNNIYVIKEIKGVTMSGILTHNTDRGWLIVDGTKTYLLSDWLDKFEAAQVEISIKRWDLPFDEGMLLTDEMKAQVGEPTPC